MSKHAQRWVPLAQYDFQVISSFPNNEYKVEYTDSNCFYYELQMTPWIKELSEDMIKRKVPHNFVKGVLQNSNGKTKGSNEIFAIFYDQKTTFRKKNYA